MSDYIVTNGEIESTRPVETKMTKMNVRSPFYVIATEEGKPDGIQSGFDQATETPTDVPDSDGVYTNENLPDKPLEYVEPEVEQIRVYDGDNICTGVDVGTRVFEFDTGEDTVGTITIDYDINVPIKVSANHGSFAYAVEGGDYVGNSQFETNLIEAGISTGDMSLASNARKTGTLTIIKTEATYAQRFVNVVVYAPIPTDDYCFTFNAPAAPVVPDPYPITVPNVGATLPSTPDGSKIAVNDLAFHTTFLDREGLPLLVNGVDTGLTLEANTTYLFTDNSFVGDFYFYNPQDTRTTVFIDKSQYFVTGYNKVSFNLTPGSRVRLEVARAGIFHDGTDWKWTWAANTLSSGSYLSYDHSYTSGGKNGFINFAPTNYISSPSTWYNNEVYIGWHETGTGGVAYLSGSKTGTHFGISKARNSIDYFANYRYNTNVILNQLGHYLSY
jgi:hypothetical protein